MTCDPGCIPTPQSILDDDQVNVFREIIGVDDPYYAAKMTALWARFRYRAIGSLIKTDLEANVYDYWLQCMRDRYDQIKAEYDLKFSAWTTWLEKIENEGINFNAAKSGSSSESTHEDLPDTADAAASTWLSTRDKNSVDYTSEAGMQSARVRSWMDAVPNPSMDFAREFDEYFYWGL